MSVPTLVKITGILQIIYYPWLDKNYEKSDLYGIEIHGVTIRLSNLNTWENNFYQGFELKYQFIDKKDKRMF